MALCAVGEKNRLEIAYDPLQFLTHQIKRKCLQRIRVFLLTFRFKAAIL